MKFTLVPKNYADSDRWQVNFRFVDATGATFKQSAITALPTSITFDVAGVVSSTGLDIYGWFVGETSPWGPTIVNYAFEEGKTYNVDLSTGAISAPGTTNYLVWGGVAAGVVLLLAFLGSRRQ